MIHQAIRPLAVSVLVWLACVATPASLSPPQDATALEKQEKPKEFKRPSFSLKATPTVAFAPARVSLVAELKGDAIDPAEYYCPSIEWDWDDGTKSESTIDCDPYVEGKTQIQKRFTTTRTYRRSGNYQIQISLKRRDRVIVSANTTIQVRGGLMGS
jgi:hypothetical protein